VRTAPLRVELVLIFERGDGLVPEFHEHLGELFMRKLLVLSAFLAGTAFFGNITPSQAAMGCLCGRLTQAPVCTSGISACVNGLHGLCVSPCDYKAPKMSKRRVHVHKTSSAHKTTHKM
jgi:hypothetical protein